jgi:predicted RNA-binding protein
MCLNGGPFLLVQNDQETPLEDVASVVITGGQLRLIDIFGKHRDLPGVIQEIDLMNQRIVLA